MTAREPRHRWPKESTSRTELETVRQCPKCHLLKITYHGRGRFPEIGWERDGKTIHSKTTPACVPTGDGANGQDHTGNAIVLAEGSPGR